MDRNLDNHKKVIAIMINVVRNSRYADLMADIVDNIHREGLHLVVFDQKPYHPALFDQIIILDHNEQI